MPVEAPKQSPGENRKDRISHNASPLEVAFEQMIEDRFGGYLRLGTFLGEEFVRVSDPELVADGERSVVFQYKRFNPLITHSGRVLEAFRTSV